MESHCNESKISYKKVKDVLIQNIKSTDWLIELRYFLTVFVISLTAVMGYMIIILRENVLFAFTIGVVIGFGLWSFNMSYTAHELRKKNINHIICTLEPMLYHEIALYRKIISRIRLIEEFRPSLNEYVAIIVIKRLYMPLSALITSMIMTYNLNILSVALPNVTPMTSMYAVLFGGLFVLVIWFCFIYACFEDLWANYYGSYKINIKTKIIVFFSLALGSLLAFAVLILPAQLLLQFLLR